MIFSRALYVCVILMWIIGDIHGCLTELELLLERLPKKEGLIFLGDYIDRGPDSAGTVERLLQEKDRSIFLMGNHENMMLAFYNRQDSPEDGAWLFAQNGGYATLSSYGLQQNEPFDKLPLSHQKFFMRLKLYHEASDFIAVHAGLRISHSTALKNQRPHDLLWIRHEWIQNEHHWPGKKVYYGHTPSRVILGSHRQTEPIIGKKSIGLDTGCVYGGCLTALKVEDETMIQIPFQGSFSGFAS